MRCGEHENAIDLPTSGAPIRWCPRCGAIKIADGWNQPSICRADVGEMFDSLSSVQGRCSELLEVAIAASRAWAAGFNSKMFNNDLEQQLIIAKIIDDDE